MRKDFLLLALLLTFSLISCGHMPLGRKTEAPKEKKVETVEQEPKPGDVKVVDGVEYIYVRNRRFGLSPQEPEYVWVRKDEYRPGLADAISGIFTERRERQELERRIAKLEEELKRKEPGGQILRPQQYTLSLALSIPSPGVRRKVIVLPIEDKSNFKEENLGELATRRIISKIESTGYVICVEPSEIKLTGSPLSPENMRILNEIYGIQAVIAGELISVYTTTSKLEGKEEKEVSFAVSNINIGVYSTETGLLLRRLSGRNPVSLSMEKGDLSSERAKLRAIDLALEVISEDLIKSILQIEWHGRIASVDGDRVYLNAGRLSGLKVGDVLEVYGPGSQIYDEATKKPIGIKRGQLKGEIEIKELFGIDASMAKVKKGGNFTPSDLVFLKGD